MLRLVRYIFAILIAIPSFLHAQAAVKVTGTVIDSLTGTPIENAAVLVLEEGSGDYTGQEGRFALPNLFSGDYTLRISHVSYRAKNREITVRKGQPLHLTIILSRKYYLTDSLRVTSPYESPTVIELTRSDIADRPSSSAADLLLSIPGISITRESGSGTESIRIHGSEPNQVLVLLDGIPLNNPLTGEVDLDGIPADIIEKIQIRTQGGSAKYGSGALAGVVAIDTRSNPVERIWLDGSLGSFGEKSLSLFTSGNPYGLEYTLTAEQRSAENDYPYRYRLADGTMKQDRRRNADIRTRTIHGALSTERDNHRFEVSLHHLQSQRGLPGRIHLWTPYAQSKKYRSGGSLTYDGNFMGIETDFRSSYGQSVSVYRNRPPDDAPLKYRMVPSYESKYYYRKFTNRLSGSYDITGNIRWTGDLNYSVSHFRQSQEESEFSDPVRAHQADAGLGTGLQYSTTVFSPDYRLNVTPRLRYSYISLSERNSDITYPFVSSSLDLSLRHQPPPAVTGYLRLDRSFRIPTFGDLFFQDFRISGNPELNPEQSKNISTGLRFHAPKPVNLSLEGELFWRAVRDQIIWVTGSFGNFSPANTDSYIYGQSITLRFKGFHDHLQSRLYFQHLLALDKSSNHALRNRQLPFRPEYQFQGNVTLDLFFSDIRYEHFYRGFRYSTRANTKTLPPYHLGALTVTKSFPIHRRFGFRVNFQIENLWDSDYQIMERMPEPGRHFKLNLTITFKQPAGEENS